MGREGPLSITHGVRRKREQRGLMQQDSYDRPLVTVTAIAFARMKELIHAYSVLCQSSVVVQSPARTLIASRLG